MSAALKAVEAGAPTGAKGNIPVQEKHLNSTALPASTVLSETHKWVPCNRGGNAFGREWKEMRLQRQDLGINYDGSCMLSKGAWILIL